MTETQVSLSRLRSKARHAALRLRVNEALRRAAVTLPVPLAYAVAALTVVKVWRLDGEAVRWLMWFGVLPAGIFVVAVGHALFRRRSPHAGSLCLDRHHALSDRVTNALVFDALPEGQRTPLMRAAIEDGLTTVARLSPRRAAPIRFPRDFAVSALLCAAVYGLSLLEVRVTREIPIPQNDFDPMMMSADDVELFRDAAEELQQETASPEVRAAVRRFNQLVEDIAERRVDRREVFKRLEEIERGMLAASEADEASLEEGLDGIAKELAKSELSKPIADALEDKRLADAEQAMRELAEKLKDKKSQVDRAKLERLRKALERASKKTVERSQKLEARRQELEERRKRLLKKKQEKKELSKKEQQELDRLDRQLERLNREKQQANRAQKQLSQLDRDLAEAARKLMEELGQSAQDLEQGAQELNRVAQKQLTRKEKEELKRSIEEMRELLRQQGKGGAERMKRLQRFGQRARGGKPGDGKGEGKGKGDGKPRLTLQRGPSGGQGVDVLMPGAGSPQGGGDPGGDQPGGGSAAGSEWGTGHDPNVQGEKSELEGKTHDVAAAGIDTGQGPSASEVIYGAADRGFTGRGYDKIFTDYQTVAESVLNQDEIPAGYEFYVRRYFQLIRPRE